MSNSPCSFPRHCPPIGCIRVYVQSSPGVTLHQQQPPSFGLRNALRVIAKPTARKEAGWSSRVPEASARVARVHWRDSIRDVGWIALAVEHQLGPLHRRKGLAGPVDVVHGVVVWLCRRDVPRPFEAARKEMSRDRVLPSRAVGLMRVGVAQRVPVAIPVSDCEPTWRERRQKRRTDRGQERTARGMDPPMIQARPCVSTG